MRQYTPPTSIRDCLTTARNLSDMQLQAQKKKQRMQPSFRLLAGSTLVFLLSDLTPAAKIPTTNSQNITQGSQKERAPSLSVPRIDCDGSLYGHDLSARSCINAFLEISTDPTVFEIETRPPRGGQLTNTLGLPYRWISGSYCYID